MAENRIKLKTISEILGMKFFIPSYQRGYRWTEQQIKDLLEDICDFKPQQDEWYCLQPLVVKQKNDNEWEVVDGQQRLTTISLIIHYFNEMWIGKQKIKEPTITYETRADSSNFLAVMKVEDNDNGNVIIDNSNIDYFHISSAYQTIHDWVKGKGQFDNNDFQSKFKEKTKVIWYETESTQDSRDIFSRINIGKIPLTNSELIKALFLNSSNFKTDNNVDDERIRLKQLEIATEWDIIENFLHNEEFWFFINKEENNKDNRIEYLFELLVGKPESEEDHYFTFRKFSEKFGNNTEEVISNNWKDVKRYFQILQNWFENRELYHKIGFLITIGEDIKNLISESLNHNKKRFITFIEDKIKEKLKYVVIDNLEYGKNNKIIKEILLLHNIKTMLNNEKENSRFPFNRYKKEKWDIEHIHARASEAKVEDDFDEQKQWLQENFEKDDNVHNNEDTNKRIEIYKETIGKKDDNFQEIIEYVLGEEDNNLRNLCLLDKGTNRSYKNDSFKLKRKKIIEQEKKGTFIPICTRNVFMKYYSTELKQLGQWSESDRTSYVEDIKTVLEDYLPKENKK